MDIHGAIQPARDWKLQPIKSHKFFGTGSGHGKVKQGREFLTPKNTKGMRFRS